MQADRDSVLFLEDSDTDFELAVHGMRSVAPDLSFLRFETRRALEEFASSPPPRLPRLLVIDVRLPDGNGLESVEKMRRSEAFRDVPIVVFSSSDDPETARAAERVGANACRVKPLDVREYILTVQEIARTAM